MARAIDDGRVQDHDTRRILASWLDRFVTEIAVWGKEPVRGKKPVRGEEAA
jgi:hypothetical protein